MHFTHKNLKYGCKTVTVSYTPRAWINVTDVGNKFRIDPVQWLSYPEVVEYIVYYHMYLNNDDYTYVKEFNLLRKKPSVSKERLFSLARKTGLIYVAEYATARGVEVCLHPKIAIPFIRCANEEFYKRYRSVFMSLLYPESSEDLCRLDIIDLQCAKTGLSVDLQSFVKYKVKESVEHLPTKQRKWGEIKVWREIKKTFGDNLRTVHIADYLDVIYFIDILNQKVSMPARYIGRFPLISEDYDDEDDED